MWLDDKIVRISLSMLSLRRLRMLCKRQPRFCWHSKGKNESQSWETVKNKKKERKRQWKIGKKVRHSDTGTRVQGGSEKVTKHVVTLRRDRLHQIVNVTISQIENYYIPLSRKRSTINFACSFFFSPSFRQCYLCRSIRVREMKCSETNATLTLLGVTDWSYLTPLQIFKQNNYQSLKIIFLNS